MFAEGMSAVEVASVLEVSTKSGYAWRRAWAAGGPDGLASRGAPGRRPRLSQAQQQRLLRALEDGPAAAGWEEEQYWTLARVATLIARMFHITVARTTVWQLLRQVGWRPQQPIARAAERDEAAIARWRRYQWPAVKGSRAGWARGSVLSMKRV